MPITASCSRWLRRCGDSGSVNIPSLPCTEFGCRRSRRAATVRPSRARYGLPSNVSSRPGDSNACMSRPACPGGCPTPWARSCLWDPGYELTQSKTRRAGTPLRAEYIGLEAICFKALSGCPTGPGKAAGGATMPAGGIGSSASTSSPSLVTMALGTRGHWSLTASAAKRSKSLSTITGIC